MTVYRTGRTAKVAVFLTAATLVRGTSRSRLFDSERTSGITSFHRTWPLTRSAGSPADFAHVGDDDFRAGRAAVLRDLVARTYLFSTPHARELWEGAARANLRRELEELEDLSGR
jgi:hypothetical protein